MHSVSPAHEPLDKKQQPVDRRIPYVGLIAACVLWFVTISYIIVGVSPDFNWMVIRMRADDIIVDNNTNTAKVLWGTLDFTCWEDNVCPNSVDAESWVERNLKQGRWHYVWRHSETGKCQYEKNQRPYGTNYYLPFILAISLFSIPSLWLLIELIKRIIHSCMYTCKKNQ